jgi:hypothetical protein
LFGSCITHILNTECAKIKKKVRRQKVKGIVAEQNKKERTVKFFKLKMCFSKMYIAFIAPYLMHK